MLKLIFLIFLLSIPIVYAFDWEITCQDNATLKRYMNFTSCNSTACEYYNITQLKECEFGCDNVTNICREPAMMEYSIYFAVIIVILISSGLILRLFKVI